MTDEPFIMISMDQAKSVANALTNKSATKILDFLANNSGATESEIAKALKLPVSTVNYNMKALLESKLVIADEFHYSPKGKEVSHYKLAKKYIIIAPADEKEGFLQRIKKYIPATLITTSVAIVWKVFDLFNQSSSLMATEATPIMMKADMARGAEAMLYDAAPQAVNTFIQPWWQQVDIIGWLLMGAFIFLIISLIIEGFRKK